MKEAYALALKDPDNGKVISIIKFPIADSTRHILEEQGYRKVGKKTAEEMRREMCADGFMEINFKRN